MNVAVDAIPAELRELPQWVVWQLEQRDGKPTKVPYNAGDPERKASSTDRATWATFEQALDAAEWLEMGIGFVLSAGDPYAGVDLDDCLAEDGLHPDAGAILAALDSYSEISPSGHGIKTIIRAGLNGFLRNRTRKTGWGGEFEVYDHDRFFTITGRLLRGCPATIEPRQEQLDTVLGFVFGTVASSSAPPPRPPQPVDVDDQELLELMFGAKHGAEVEALWRGDKSAHGDDDSAADYALCRHLAFWTGRDPGRIDRLFRSSGLYREKWERADYRERTIEAAIVATPNAYRPRPERSRGSDSADSVRGSLGAAGSNGVAESVLEDSATPDAAAPARVEEDGGTASGSDSVDDADPPARPFAIPIEEFVALDRPHREPLLADGDGRAAVGRLSLVLLGALGGHGKTTWFIDLVLHLVAGVDYPPFKVPRPISALMIENEGAEQLFAEKLGARLASFQHELRGRLDVCTLDWGGFSLADGEHRRRLIDEIAAKGYDLVFGDPLDSLGIAGVGSPDDTRKFQELMKQSGLNRTCAWWLNTHPRKEETKEALNEIAGAWGGKPDSVFLLRMLDGDRMQLRQPKLRWTRRGRGPTLLFGFDPDTESFTYIGEGSDVERDYFAEVRELLADGVWRLVKEIAAPAEAGGIGANDKFIKKALEDHPDVFELRTGDGAKALGRKPQALLWGLRLEGEDAPEPEGLLCVQSGCTSARAAGSFYCAEHGGAA